MGGEMFTATGTTREGRKYQVVWADDRLDGDEEIVGRFTVANRPYGLTPTGPFLPPDVSRGASVIAYLASTTRLEDVTGDYPPDAVAPPLPEGAVG